MPAPEGDSPAPAVVNCFAYGNGQRLGPVELDDIHQVLRFEGQFVWLGLHEPPEELLRKIQEEFDLHDLAIEDAHRAHQRPKLEEYGDSLFVVLRTVERDAATRELRFGETHLFVGSRYLVTVRHGSTRSYAEVRARCESTPQLLHQGPGFVLYAVMDFVVDRYFPVVDELEEDLESLEDAIFADPVNRDSMQQIYELRRQLLLVKRAISPLIDVCNRLVRFDLALIQPETRLYFRDVYDHVVRINETIDHMREILTTALETNLALVSVRQNEVQKKLAGWAAILAVPTAVAGIYGMNFEFMPELRSPWGYPAVMAFILVACSYLYYRLHRAGWL